MPILWRYLLAQYFKVFSLCAISFIAILLTMRLNEIAHFATLGPQAIYIFWFVLYQIFYILPIAIPIAGLISAILLIQNLSKSHELTALRASGISIRKIITPILIAAAFLALANFYIVSEVATSSHLSSGLLKNQLRSINPLLVLNNKHLMRLKGYHFDTLGASKMGEVAHDVVLALPNRSNNRITLAIAKKLESLPLEFVGNEMTLISSLSAEENSFDNLMIENIEQAATTLQDFSQMVQRKTGSLNNDHLRFSLLLARLQELKLSDVSSGHLKQHQRTVNRIYSEIVRRISIAAAAFTFTLMGIALGISVSRVPSNRGLFVVIVLAAIFLVSYFAAKGIDHLLIASSLLYMIPQLLIVSISVWALRRTARGVE